MNQDTWKRSSWPKAGRSDRGFSIKIKDSPLVLFFDKFSISTLFLLF